MEVAVVGKTSCVWMDGDTAASVVGAVRFGVVVSAAGRSVRLGLSESGAFPPHEVRTDIPSSSSEARSRSTMQGRDGE